ncbi:MAG: cysteine desulfurase [Oscillospiraceae bacterium]|nr:cysteine desulfurase [Oscillospiraceae bacterium]
MMIYADNAATTKMSRAAIEAMTACLEEEYGNPSSLYALGQRAKERLEQARGEIAAVIGADPGEITITSGGSEADNQALRTGAALGKRAGKTHIISTAFEHHAILHTLKRLEEEGFSVTLLPVHEDGLVRVEELEAAIREDTCLVSVMYANNEIGTIQPIREIGAVCRKHGVLFHTDAVQAVGHVPIDVKEQNIDMLSSSAHKFHGPKGIGFLYARKGVRLVNLIEGGAQEGGKRAGTENVAAAVSMAAATSSGRTSPSSWTGSRVTEKPSSSSFFRVWRMAWCSKAVEMRWVFPFFLPARAALRRAWLSASLPPEVMMISRGSALMTEAISPLAFSRVSLASWPRA